MPTSLDVADRGSKCRGIIAATTWPPGSRFESLFPSRATNRDFPRRPTGEWSRKATPQIGAGVELPAIWPRSSFRTLRAQSSCTQAG